MISEKLLRKADIAAMLGTTPGVAASILAQHGVQPIDFGMGRARGLRWLESAVRAAMQSMHVDAQASGKPRARGSMQPKKAPAVSLSSMSTNELYAILTSQRAVQ